MSWWNWILHRKPRIISPTGLGIRVKDPWGYGHYGAPRPHGIHRGVDYRCLVGQIVVMPISGEVVRVARPYADGLYLGVEIRSEKIAVKLFYFTPDDGLIGAYINQGERIGIAQDIRLKYDNRMIPHLHLEVTSVDPGILMT